MAKNENIQCPICSGSETIRHVRCSYDACPFVIISCTNCDRDRIVAAAVADHEKDCAHGPGVGARSVTFVPPRQVA